MNKYKVLKSIRIRSESYAPGDTVSLSEKEQGLDLLVSREAIRLIGKEVSKQPVESAKVDISAKSDSKMEEAIDESKKIVAEASKEAEAIIADAKTKKSRKKATTSSK